MNTIQKRQRTKELTDELAALKRQVEQEERNCHHVFGDPVSDPIVTPNMQFSHYEEHGSDPNPVYVKAGTNSQPRWKRTCTKCGKVQYTEKRKTTAITPDFS